MLAEIENLRIAFPTPSGPVEAVRGVSLTLGQEKLGIVGESGSGKSLTARSLLRLLPAQALVAADRLAFDGIDVLRASERQMREIRGKRAGLILQDPKYSLNPVMTAGAADRRGLAHAQGRQPPGGAMQAAVDLLEQVLHPRPRARRRRLPARAVAAAWGSGS